jgi:hypothetical protein
MFEVPLKLFSIPVPFNSPLFDLFKNGPLNFLFEDSSFFVTLKGTLPPKFLHFLQICTLLVFKAQLLEPP